MDNKFDTPLEKRHRFWHLRPKNTDRVGRASEAVAYFFGTPSFMVWLSVFCLVWLAWNTWMPRNWQFDSAELGFTALTLMLSLQASYAAPLILLAQNRQAERDKVVIEQDRQRAERNLADTEFLTREIASLRLSVSEVVTRDFLRSELRDLVTELNKENEDRLAERDALIASLQEEIEQLRENDSEDTAEKKPVSASAI